MIPFCLTRKKQKDNVNPEQVERMKPTLLFIHGAGGNHRVWEYQLKFFENAIAVDLAGHDGGVGKSTIDEYVEEVKRFCDEKQDRNNRSLLVHQANIFCPSF